MTVTDSTERQAKRKLCFGKDDKEIPVYSKNMGVKTLWSVIGGAGEPTDLRSLQGKCVAIDLAGWAVQGGQCSGMYRSGVTRPHLRNLFFRSSALLTLNIRPIFVLDGDAPELKRAELINRRNAELGTQHQTQNSSNETGQAKLCRSRLKGIMRECAELLDTLGVSWVQAAGEAEFAAARLNAEGKVDAIITDDSDAFCFGAVNVLRNFTISGSSSVGGTASVECYTIDKLKSTLNIDRRRFIFMALLLGCDFCPAGISGLGKETVRQLLYVWPLRWDPIRILYMWVRQNFAETPVTRLRKITSDKKPSAKQAKSYVCPECSVNIQSYDTSNSEYASENHCSDCQDWRKYVFIDDLSHNECHCAYLTKNTHEAAFEGEAKDMFKLENIVKKKCRAMQDSTDIEVYEEFWKRDIRMMVDEFENVENGRLIPKYSNGRRQCKKVNINKFDDHDDLQVFPPPLTLPDVKEFVPLATKKLAWTEEYALEKILPIVCRTQLTLIAEHQLQDDSKKERFMDSNDYLFDPVKLTKQRVAAGIPCYSVEWRRRESVKYETLRSITIPEYYESCEPECLLVKSFPKLVEYFQSEKLMKQKKRKPKAIKVSKTAKEITQKPITEFFSEAKTSLMPSNTNRLPITKVASVIEDSKINRIAIVNSEKNSNCKLNKNKNLKTSDNVKVNHTPAIEKAKRELMRKVFEESPDQRNSAMNSQTSFSSGGKENIPLQSTPIQPISKRNKDFTHKTPIFASSKLKELENEDTLKSNKNIENGCEDLSFIVDDIICRKHEENGCTSSIRVNEELIDNVPDKLLKPEARPFERQICKTGMRENRSSNSLTKNPFIDDTLEDSFDRMCL